MFRKGPRRERQEPKINQVSAIDPRSTALLQPRAIGAAKLSVMGDENGTTRLVKLRQSGSSKLVFPKTHTKDVEVVMVNTAGGVTGGDTYELDVSVQANAALTLTTQAAERAYRAQGCEVGQITTNLSVQSGARLNWLPQELILFEGCNLHRRLTIDLASEARLLMVEPIIFGRTAMGETLQNARFRDRIKINRDGCPIYIDGMDFHGNLAAQLARPAVANGAKAMASVVMVAPVADRHLGAIREALPTTAGVSALTDDILVIRILASGGLELRRSLVPILEHLLQSTLPMSWRL